MNAYLADRTARDHADALMADASAARRARRARQDRKRRQAAAAPTGATPSPEPARGGGRAATVALLVRPYALFHMWLAAGQL